MPYLNWISDTNLKNEVNNLLSIAKNAQRTAFSEFGKNIIDPFAALFEMSGFEIEFQTWLKSETSRQAQKTLQNHVGDFHQNILGYSSEWTNMKIGNVIDLVSEKKKMIAEIKNKFNTISGGKLSDLYYSLDKLISPKLSIYKGYTAFYVAIIPQKGKRYNIPFTPSDKEKGEKCPKNENIRAIDGASFYSLATGSDTALEDLFDVLPDVINECHTGNYQFKDQKKLKEFFISAYHKY
ncbi:MAG TPA: Eco47II family restriction endonuclease [Prolixibacteraceae bacterium]|nr:Eco47II family restriction endonuclease [Prolixibacteraceae bacterium]